mmetsp:Transcript_32257/g.104196  ORF Transcript_32257/g.104196 Transcript_32257/m.104196 type:complete len:309 (+) Transcript_32257:283-1209(+)
MYLLEHRDSRSIWTHAARGGRALVFFPLLLLLPDSACGSLVLHKTIEGRSGADQTRALVRGLDPNRAFLHSSSPVDLLRRAYLAFNGRPMQSTQTSMQLACRTNCCHSMKVVSASNHHGRLRASRRRLLGVLALPLPLPGHRAFPAACPESLLCLHTDDGQEHEEAQRAPQKRVRQRLRQRCVRVVHSECQVGSVPDKVFIPGVPGHQDNFDKGERGVPGSDDRRGQHPHPFTHGVHGHCADDRTKAHQHQPTITTASRRGVHREQIEDGAAGDLAGNQACKNVHGLVEHEHASANKDGGCKDGELEA